MRSNRFDIKIDDINMQHTSGNEGRKKGWKKQKKGGKGMKKRGKGPKSGKRPHSLSTLFTFRALIT